MRKIILFILVIMSISCFSQARFNGYFVYSSIGTMQKEYSNIKISTNTFQGIIGKEFLLNSHISLLGGISFENMYSNYGYLGNNYNLNSKYLGIPIWFRYYDSTQEQATFFVGLGVVNRMIVKETSVNLSLNASTNGTNDYHMTSYAELGFRTKIRGNMDGVIGLNYGSDFIKPTSTRILNSANVFLAFEIFDDQNR